MGVCIKCGMEIDPHEEPEYNIWLTYRKDGHMAYSPKVIFSEYICSDCKERLMNFLTKDGGKMIDHTCDEYVDHTCDKCGKPLNTVNWQMARVGDRYEERVYKLCGVCAELADSTLRETMRCDGRVRRV